MRIIPLLLCFFATASAFSPTMCQVSKPVIPELLELRHKVPIICKPARTNTERANKKHNVVYEATFEDEGLVLRPRRARVKRSHLKKIHQLWFRLLQAVLDLVPTHKITA